VIQIIAGKAVRIDGIVTGLWRNFTRESINSRLLVHDMQIQNKKLISLES